MVRGVLARDALVALAPGSGLLAELARASTDAGVDLGGLGLAWARVAPTIALVPAFGLKAQSAPARGVLALALAGAIFPSVRPAPLGEGAWPLLLLEQVLLGLPLALAAAVPLWAATMAGGMIDNLRGSQHEVQLPIVEGRASSLGVMLSLFASAVFLSTGGPARLAESLARASTFGSSPLLEAATSLTAGIGVAVGIGAPLLAGSVVVEVAFALVARAASPAQIHALLAPIRALGLLAIMALVLDRIAALVAVTVRAAG